MKKTIVIILFCLGILQPCVCQETYVSETNNKLNHKACKSFTTRAIKKCDRLTEKLRQSNTATLSKLHANEYQLFRSLCTTNEKQAESLMRGSIYSYRHFEDQIKLHGDENINSYVSEFDSLRIFSSYIENINSDTALTENCKCEGLTELKQAQNNLQRELKRTEILQQHIKKRNSYLHKVAMGSDESQKFLPSIEKLEYYNNSQYQEYLSIFSDRSRPERMFSKFLNSIPEFTQFANVNGSLAKFNSIPTNSSMAGLQTKEEVYSLMSQASGRNIDQNALLRNISPDSEIDKIQSGPKQIAESIEQTAGNLKSHIPDMTTKVDSLRQVNDSLNKEKKSLSKKTDWKPNPLKTKRFIDRLNYGFNIQADPSTKFFPTTTSLLGQISYQVTTKMNLGMGTSYMLGYIKKSDADKKGIGSIESNGYSLRSFYDLKIKSNIYFQMNYEWNFRSSSLDFIEKSSIRDPFFKSSMNGYESWLAGLKLKTGNSKRKSNTMEVLYDFNHKKTGQPSIVVRLGMNFLPKHGINNTAKS